MKDLLRRKESPAQKQARLKEDADLKDLLRRKESPVQKQARLEKQAHLQEHLRKRESLPRAIDDAETTRDMHTPPYNPSSTRL